MNGTGIVLLFACAVGACTDAPSDTYELALRYSPTPPSVGPARLLFEFTDSLGVPVTGAAISVEARPAAEAAIRYASAQETGRGQYVIDGYEFNAAGSWLLEVRARTSQGTEITRVFETPVYPGPGDGSPPE